MPFEPRFGLFMGQASKPWSQVRDEFALADELGFDHAWLVDHLVDADGPRRVIPALRDELSSVRRPG